MEPTEKTGVAGAKILLIGPGGTGKTHSLTSLCNAGLEVFVLFTGETGMQSATRDERVHYRVIRPMNVGWSVIRTMAERSNKFSTDALLKTDGKRGLFTQFLEVIDTCNNFECDHCGKSFGDVEKWSTDRVLVVDHLSGLSRMCRYLLVGGRTGMSQPELYNAQGNLDRFIRTLALETKCHVVLISHEDTDRDEFSGRVTHYPGTPGLGKALRATFAPDFDDVICAVRVGNKFSWSTTEADHDGLKANNLEWKSEQNPSFEPLIKRWQARGGVIRPTVLTKSPS